jgi:uracil-DNA glycosylase family 4
MSKPDWCLGCPLHSAPGPVFGPPPSPNKLLFLGEAPGKDEVAVNRNFIGGSGRVLYRWCGQVGIHRDSAEVRNVVKCRPTEVNNNGKEVDRAPTEAEIRHCAVFLSKELETIRPNLIVALGATALYVTTGRVQIGTYRGRILEGPTLHDKDNNAERKTKVLAVYHPAFIMRSQELYPLAVHDLAKAKTEAEFPELRRIEVKYNTSGSLPCSGEDFVNAARASGFITFDLEAEGIVGKKGKGLDLSTGQITVMGLATRPYEGHALHWTPETQRVCRELFADPNIEKVGQNSEGFDIPYIERRGLSFNGPSFDTLQAFHLTNSELEKNLEFIASLYSDIDVWKGKEMYKAGFEALKLGNCKDIDATTRAYIGLKSELTSLGMTDLYYKSVMPLQPVLRNMSSRGLRRNEEAAFRLSVGCKRTAANMEVKLKNVLGQDLNLDSPKQLSDLLYNRMGLPVQYKRDKKRGFIPTVDDNALDALATLTDNAIFKLVLQRRKIKKLDSTYLEGIETDEDNFVHYKLGSAKAATEKGKDEHGKEKGSGARNGRLVSWQPNFQNQPPECRDLYIPDSPEDILIEADWKQVEWAAAMVLSGEPFGLSLLAAGADNHSVVAAECFGLTLDEVKRLDEEYSGGHGSPRFETKFIVYGLGYGRGAADIAKQLSRPIQWVESFMQRFRTRFPVYWAWRGNLEGFVAKNSYLRNFAGRRRWWYTKQVTEVYNFPPSSTAADMMYLILPMLERQLPHGATLRLTVHDSVLINAQRECVRRAIECVRDIMHTKWPAIVDFSDRPEVVKRYYPNGWFCPADIHLGGNWRECKKGNKQLEKELGL